jgi:hypothetical protein
VQSRSSIQTIVCKSGEARLPAAREWLASFGEFNGASVFGSSCGPASLPSWKQQMLNPRQSSKIEKHLKASSAADASLGELHRALEQLLNANRDFALAQRKQEATSERYKSWRGTVKPLIERVIELSYGRITALKLNDK